ncbi:MAG: hypothetical protein KDK10_12460 [Maritimibacter sp.]|nr:hypothetical protein [Maritimibacter sp.]
MTRETLKNTAKNAAETARAAGADALKKARDEAAEVVTTAAQAIRAEAEARADEGKAQISREGLRLTDALKERAATADYELERRVLDAVASGVAEMSQGLRTRSVSSIIEDTERFARNHPGAFVAGAAIAGFALARFARASGGGGERPMPDAPRPVPIVPANTAAAEIAPSTALVRDDAVLATEMQS